MWGRFMWHRLISGPDGGRLAAWWEAGGGHGPGERCTRWRQRRRKLGGSWLCLEGTAGRTCLDIGEGVELSLDDDWVSAGGRDGTSPPGGAHEDTLTPQLVGVSMVGRWGAEGKPRQHLDLPPGALWWPVEKKAVLAEHLLLPPLAGASLQSVLTPFLHREKKIYMPRFPLIHPESMLLKNLTRIWLKSQSIHFMF